MGSLQNNQPLDREKLGAILVKRGRISAEQLQEALAKQENDKTLIGEILVKLGFLEEIDIVVALILQCGIPYIAIKKYAIDPQVLRMIPEEVAREFHAIALDRVGDVLSVVMADPLNEAMKKSLAQIANCRIAPFIATKTEIDEAIVQWYGAR